MRYAHALAPVPMAGHAHAGAQYLRMRIDFATPYFATSVARVDRLLESAMAASSVESFTVEEFGSFLSDKNVDEEVIDNFKRNKVSGAAFLMLTERDINELVPSVGLRPQIRAILKGSNKVWIYLTSHVYLNQYKTNSQQYLKTRFFFVASG